MARTRDSSEIEKKEEKSEQATIQYLLETLGNLQKENEILRRKGLTSEQKPSGKIGFVLLTLGALTLIVSVLDNSTVLAFIGLGLTFWGALFLFARPMKFVRGTLLDSTAISSYTTIDRILKDLNIKGKPVYIPPYPKEAYLPEYLKGLKEMVVFIPAQDVTTMPTIEEMAKKQFMIKNPKGICIAPPGYGLINLFEKELRSEFTSMNLESLFDSLPSIIVKNLELAKELEIALEHELIHSKITGSAYNDLYSGEQGLKSIHTIGCPLASAIACALAKTTGKTVAIAKDTASPDLKIVDVWYQILEV